MCCPQVGETGRTGQSHGVDYQGYALPEKQAKQYQGNKQGYSEPNAASRGIKYNQTYGCGD
jgi:hypothetical protein